jgi:pyruvate,water dikinase
MWRFPFRRRPRVPFKLLFARFRQLLDNNTRVLQLLADASEKLNGEYVFDRSYVRSVANRLFDLADKIVYDLNSLADQRHAALYAVVEQLRAEALGDIAGRPAVPRTHLCLPFRDVDESVINLVGGKSAHLGEIAARLGVPIPPGFTITTHAYLRVVEKNDLAPLIEAAIEHFVCEDVRVCETVCRRLREAKLPRDVSQAVLRATAEIGDRGRPLHLAVRSSALGEDDDLSFAGQYSTVLQVERDGVLDAYRQVLASLYTPSAIAYRQACGLPPDGLMAVACMRMVAASAAGVLYTVDPLHPDNDRMLLSATRGLAGRAVAGEQRLSSYELSREPPHAVLRYRPADVADKLVGREHGGTAVVPLAPEDRTAPELTAEEAARVAELGLRMERYFKQPQDVEWARDADGTIYVIQARRLKVAAAPAPRDLPKELERYQVLLRGRGHAACRGVGHGLVHLVTDDSDLDGVPSGAVLVARCASPRFVRVMPRVAAIVTDIGAPTGHMAALAREFRVPTIVDCGDATTRLPRGWDVTVDADDCVVYAGHVEELLHHQLVEETDFEDAPEYRLLRRLLRRLTPLQLVDPQSETFRAERCRTLHDVIRFAHETAVEEIIDLHARGGVSGTGTGRRLAAKLPLNLHVIDIGGGISANAAALPAGMPIGPDSIVSLPMRALWHGLTTPGVWSTRPVEVDMRTFMASAMSRAVSHSTGRNLAVVSDAYVNLSLNLGYHYNMVDAYVCDDREANHVYVRFLGGAADKVRRTRRATMVREVLERLDFTARQSADLVVARLRKLPRAETEARLDAVGRLVGYTRQIDALMRTDDSARRYVDAFLRNDYTLD